MKTLVSIFWGTLLLLTTGWLGWTFMAQDTCVRIKRGALPVRVTFDLIGWTGKNWTSGAEKLDWIAEGLEWDREFQMFLSKHFYGKSDMCVQLPNKEG